MRTSAARVLGGAAVAAVLVVVNGAPMPSSVPAQSERDVVSEVAFRASDDWAPDAPSATATSFVLVDANTGQELAARDPDVRLPVASTIKLLTVLTALETVDLDDIVTVGEEVVVGEASVGLQPGDQWSVRDLVEGVIARSGNDAARALAVHAAGDVATFVERMQQTASGLGINAVIEDPVGLDDTNMLSANDLAILGREALRQPVIAEIADEQFVDLPGVGRVESRNLLLGRRDEVTGLKTGFTTASGYCLVSSMVTDDGRELVAVVLGSFEDGTRFAESLALLDHGDDDLVPLGLIAGARIRLAGGWVDQTDLVDVSVPLSPAPQVVADWGSDGIVQRVLSDGAQVAASTTVVRGPGTAAEGPGSALVDRAYQVMRAAHRNDLWDLPLP